MIRTAFQNSGFRFAIWITLILVIVYRFAFYVPLPGIE